MDDSSPKYAQAHDMESWLSDPQIAERGFAHRWRSAVAADNGEDAFIALIDRQMRPDCDVLDVGCGHGELTLDLAVRCRTIVGIERNAEYLKLARELTAEYRGLNNFPTQLREGHRAIVPLWQNLIKNNQ